MSSTAFDYATESRRVEKALREALGENAAIKKPRKGGAGVSMSKWYLPDSTARAHGKNRRNFMSYYGKVWVGNQKRFPLPKSTE